MILGIVCFIIIEVTKNIVIETKLRTIKLWKQIF